MLIRQAQDWLLKGAKTQSMQCSNCSNTGDHVVVVHPFGAHVGTIFSKKPLFTKKQYFWTCPTCGAFSEEISKQVAMAQRG
jgi:hypothetical protein